jgi:hypothetical protein
MDLGVLVRQLQGAVSWKRRTGGHAFVTTTAAVTGLVTVTHGLGSTPNRVFTQAVSGNGVVNSTPSNYTATTFDLAIQYVDGTARSTTITVEWEAVL